MIKVLNIQVQAGGRDEFWRQEKEMARNDVKGGSRLGATTDLHQCPFIVCSFTGAQDALLSLPGVAFVKLTSQNNVKAADRDIEFELTAVSERLGKRKGSDVTQSSNITELGNPTSPTAGVEKELRAQRGTLTLEYKQKT
jgi:hypothetical protein